MLWTRDVLTSDLYIVVVFAEDRETDKGYEYPTHEHSTTSIALVSLRLVSSRRQEHLLESTARAGDVGQRNDIEAA